MIPQKQAVPRLPLQFCLPFTHDLLKLPQIHTGIIPFAKPAVSQIGMFKLEYHVQLLLRLPCVSLCLRNCNPCRFSNSHNIITGQHFLVHLLQELMHPGTIHDMFSQIPIQPIVCLAVREFLIFGNHTDHIHAETVNPLITPPAHHIIYRISGMFIFPVNIRLFFMERVQVIHIRPFVIFPCRPSKAGAPVIRRRSIFFPFPPDIIIPVSILLRLPAFHKPLMFIGCVVYYQIHHNTNPSFMGFLKHFIKIFHCSELIHNGLIIADIIPIVIIRGLIYRR